MSKVDAPTVPAKASQTESGDISTPGVVLIASLGCIVCWVLTGIIGYNSPSTPFQDDITFMALFLWVPQFVASFYLVYKFGERAWWTPAAALSAVIVGFGAAVALGVCWAEWGNVATKVFWTTGAVYAALGVEAWLGVAESAEQSVARMLEE